MENYFEWKKENRLSCTWFVLFFCVCLELYADNIIQYIELQRRYDVKQNEEDRRMKKKRMEKSLHKQNWITSHNNISDYSKDYLLVCETRYFQSNIQNVNTKRMFLKGFSFVYTIPNS